MLKPKKNSLFCNVQLGVRGRNVSISLSHVCIHDFCNQTFFISIKAMIELGIFIASFKL